MNAVIQNPSPVIARQGFAAPPACIEHFPVFPIDLRLWASEPELLRWVLDAVSTNFPKHVPSVAPTDVMDVTRILQVLAYALVTGPASSETISARCSMEPTLRNLAGGSRPFPREITEFRRANRPILQAVIASIFEHALEKDLGSAIAEERKSYCLRQAGERLDMARHFDATEE